MKEYITKKDALLALDEAVELSCYDYEKIENAINICKPADVVPISQKKIYKDILNSLLEDVLNLREQYSSACGMCLKDICDDCYISSFVDKLSDIIARASERKERLVD